MPGIFLLWPHEDGRDRNQTRMPGLGRRSRKYLLAGLGLAIFLSLTYLNSPVWPHANGKDYLWGKIPRLGKSNKTTAGNADEITELDFPSDYTYESEDQKDCERVYGSSYLTHIATHQHSYCDARSPGQIQCFEAPRLGAPWTSDWQKDPMCVARGVLYNPPSPTSNLTTDKPFTVQCDPRMPTQDVTGPSEQGSTFPPLDKMGIYWFETGIGTQLKEWDFNARKDTHCSNAVSSNGWILLARRERNSNIWHKLMEPWQAMLTMDALQIAINPETGKPWLSKTDAESVEVVFEDDREEIYDHWWTMVTGSPPTRRSAITPGTCFSNVILPLAGSSSPFWTALLESVYHETCRTQFLLNTFLRRIFRFLELTPRAPSDIHVDPTITIIERKDTRKLIDLNRWVEILRLKYRKSTINVVDFADISLVEQVKLVQSTDVLVGHHGAAMTHVLFLPPESAVVEIMPPFFEMRGFRSVARMRGLTHFSARCMWPEEWNATVNNVPLPEGWQAPQTKAGWQEAEWAYMTEEDFVGYVDAAVRHQQNRRYDGT